MQPPWNIIHMHLLTRIPIFFLPEENPEELGKDFTWIKIRNESDVTFHTCVCCVIHSVRAPENVCIGTMILFFIPSDLHGHVCALSHDVLIGLWMNRILHSLENKLFDVHYCIIYAVCDTFVCGPESVSVNVYAHSTLCLHTYLHCVFAYKKNCKCVCIRPILSFSSICYKNYEQKLL